MKTVIQVPFYAHFILEGYCSINNWEVLFDLGIKEQLFTQALHFNPCTATSTDYLLQLL